MAQKTGNISKLRVGEIGIKITKNGRRITMKRIRSTGFPQFKIIKNEAV